MANEPQMTFTDSAFAPLTIGGQSYEIRFDFTDNRSGPGDADPCVGWINGVLLIEGHERVWDVGGGWVQQDGTVVTYRGHELGDDVAPLAEALGLDAGAVGQALIDACPDTWPEADGDE